MKVEILETIQCYRLLAPLFPEAVQAMGESSTFINTDIG